MQKLSVELESNCESEQSTNLLYVEVVASRKSFKGHIAFACNKGVELSALSQPYVCYAIFAVLYCMYSASSISR